MQHCTTSHIFYIALIPHHSHIRMNKVQHPASGIAKHSTSHQIYTTLSTSRHVWSGGIKYVEWCEVWYGVLCRKCGSMWNIELWWWLRCGMYNTDIAIASCTSLHHYHHILHCIIPHQTPSLTLFQTTPHHTHQYTTTVHPTTYTRPDITAPVDWA